MSSRNEFDEREQYHNKIHEVTLKDGTVFRGHISRIDYEKRTFRLLEFNKPGMLGKDGREFFWDDCRSVNAESQRAGLFQDQMIPQWERWARQSGVK